MDSQAKQKAKNEMNSQAIIEEEDEMGFESEEEK